MHEILAATLLLSCATAVAQHVVADPARAGYVRCVVTLTEPSIDLTPIRSALAEDWSLERRQQLLLQLAHAARDAQAGLAAHVTALGGSVSTHWWIVNACAVELPLGAVAGLFALPEVARVDEDQLIAVAQGHSADRYNHAVDTVRALGFAGAGITVAILDGGQDLNVGSSRPHRIYYTGGNPNNSTGPGIGGSRLLHVRTFGLLGPDQAACHGLAVASELAGGGFAPAGIAPGVADQALLCGYSIADVQAPGCGYQAQTSTMISGWQGILADRVTMPQLAVANASISGFDDPLHPVSQAMDNLASAGDVFVATIAGNSGAQWAFSPGATNTMVVGAVRPDVHDLLPYSSRGPVSAGFVPRSFPDIVAAIHDFIAEEDCEAGAGVFNGTSAAAPQVAGVAAVLRGAVPSLTAVETKAILLASTRDIGAANPGLGRNDIGVGMLRADTALATALDASRHGLLTVTSAAPTTQILTSVPPGAEVGIAITWFRQSSSTTGWSDLDLTVINGATVIASSQKPDDLDEMLRLRAPSSGLIQIRVTARRLQGGAQQFAFALATAAPPPAIGGTFDAFGEGCQGSAGQLGAACEGLNAGATLDDLGPSAALGDNGVAVRIVPTAAIVVRAADVLASSEPSVAATLSIHADVAGLPAATAIASAPFAIGSQPAWHRAVLAAPISLTAGVPVWIGVQAATPGHLRLALALPTAAPLAIRNSCSAAWRAAGNGPLGIRLLCGGTGGGLAPTIVASGRPTVGTTFSVDMERGMASSLVILALGTSDRTWGNVPLPLDLAAMGGPGCQLLVSADAVLLRLADAFGRSSTTVAVPPSSSLIGGSFFVQYGSADAAANALGFAVSPGARVRIGSP